MLCAKQMTPKFGESHFDTSLPTYTRHFPI